MRRFHIVAKPLLSNIANRCFTTLTDAMHPHISIYPLDVSLQTVTPRVSIVGVGGAGGNALDNMISSGLSGVEFIACNTDAQALSKSKAVHKLQLGNAVTRGHGAGAKPEIGRQAAEESLEEIMASIEGSHMVFVAAGLGGGTGTGAAPMIAREAKRKGILTVGVVTKPFLFEGKARMRIAEKGLEEMAACVDTLLVIPNQNLFLRQLTTTNTSFTDAFKIADHVLLKAVRSVTDLMLVPGLINLDFADVRSVMKNMGRAMMGTGDADSNSTTSSTPTPATPSTSIWSPTQEELQQQQHQQRQQQQQLMYSGLGSLSHYFHEFEQQKHQYVNEHRGLRAAEAALYNPLLGDLSLRKAKGVLLNITGNDRMTLHEIHEAAERVRAEVDNDANIIFGATVDNSMNNKLSVSIVATGLDFHTST